MKSPILKAFKPFSFPFFFILFISSNCKNMQMCILNIVNLSKSRFSIPTKVPCTKQRNKGKNQFRRNKKKGQNGNNLKKNQFVFLFV